MSTARTPLNQTSSEILKKTLKKLKQERMRHRPKFLKRCRHMCKKDECAFAFDGDAVECVQDIIANNINLPLCILEGMLMGKGIKKEQIRFAIKNLKHLDNSCSFIGGQGEVRSKGKQRKVRSA